MGWYTLHFSLIIPCYLLTLLFISFLSLNQIYRFSISDVDKILEFEIQNHTFPGCVALVGGQNNLLYYKAFGNFTYGIPPPMTPSYVPPMTTDTLFDLVSNDQMMKVGLEMDEGYELESLIWCVEFLGHGAYFF